MDHQESADRMETIINEVSELIAEARQIAKDNNLDMGNLDAYVFNHLQESICNSNPYNQSLNGILEQLRNIEYCAECKCQLDEDEGDRHEGRTLCPMCYDEALGQDEEEAE